jgi:hypothetical protein
MGVQTSEVGYTTATNRRGDHEVHKGHVGGEEERVLNPNITRQEAWVHFEVINVRLHFI